MSPSIRQTVRTDLRDIIKGGATSRILDLHSIAKRYHGTDTYDWGPFFLTPRLNRSFVVKHTVRPHEASWFMSNRPIVTKVIMPIDEDNLQLGGYTVAVEEIGFVEKMRAMFDNEDEPEHLERDLDRLRDLAALPSLDPFLLAERYRKKDRAVNDIYFQITEAERIKMETSVAEQMASVISMAFSQEHDKDDSRAMRFAKELLSDNPDGRMSMLRTALDMSEPEFEKGLHGWKGILYFRWSVKKALSMLKRFITEVQDVSYIGATPLETRELDEVRQALLIEMRNCWVCLSKVMEEYEDVFDRFCTGQDGGGFRTFLLKAPAFFFDLGANLSIVNHISSYWDYWWNNNKKGFLRVAEAESLFSIFLASVSKGSQRSAVMERGDKRNRVGSPIPPPPEILNLGAA